MAVLVTAEVAGQTQQGYDGMLAALAESIKAAPGFVLHSAHPVEVGWRVIEVWETRTLQTNSSPNTLRQTCLLESDQNARCKSFTAL